MDKLLQFSVENYRSYKGRMTISMSASSIKDAPASCVFECSRRKLLTINAVYGANASGKSNLVSAIKTMQQTLLTNSSLNDDDPIYTYSPFILNADTATQPTVFEIVYFNSELGRVRYGFAYNQEMIKGEWLYIQTLKTNSDKEYCYFTREDDEIWIDETIFTEGEDREENTNSNRLFLSVVAQLGGKISKKIISFFQKNLHVISGLNTHEYMVATRESFLAKDEISHRALEFFRHLELGFDDVEVSVRDNKDWLMPKHVRYNVKTRHRVYGPHDEIVSERMMDMALHESAGTQKIFDMSESIFSTLANGGILVVDELDAKMHPLISQEITKLFSDKDTNPLRAQLIFTTQDTNLLSSGLLRRDAIWLTEKTGNEDTDLYRLMDVVFADGTKPRNDANLERNYIKGRYGAIPFLKYYSHSHGQKEQTAD